MSRKTEIEARRDAWLKRGSFVTHFLCNDGTHCVMLGDATPLKPAPEGFGPDYCTALEAALNAAGAP